MHAVAPRVRCGTQFVYDGEVLEVIEMHPVAGMPEVLAQATPLMGTSTDRVTLR
jgi:hypothetical protein